MPRTPLPLPDPIFGVRVGMRAGATRKRLRGADLDLSVWGIRRSARADASLVDRCAMFAVRMPDSAFFSHVTAARLLKAPLPLALERASAPHIGVPAPGRAPHARGIRGHELSIVSTDIIEIDGLRCTSAARTWCDLAAVLSLTDLVAVGDYLIHWRLPLTTKTELADKTREFLGHRGMRRLREALPLLNNRAESHPESVLRVLLELGGLPTPEINREIIDTLDGSAVRTDLSYDAFGLILEYQGDYHRAKTQWRKDMTRRSRLEARRWQVMELNADDLRDPDELVARVAATLRNRGWRP